jgi:hypothetical protein
MMKTLLSGFLLGSLLLSCSQDEASSSTDKPLNPEVLAEETADAHKSAILELEKLLKSSQEDLVDDVDKLYDKHKAILLNHCEKALILKKNEFDQFAKSYQVKAFSDLDSSMVFIAHYRDSLVSADPGNILSAELMSYVSIGAYGSPEMMQRVFPKEFEEFYNSK